MEGRKATLTYTLANQIRILKGILVDKDSVYLILDERTGKEFAIPKGQAFVEYDKAGAP